MKRMNLTVAVCGLLLVMSAPPIWADVLNMGGTRDPATGQWTGLASLETVPVGDAGNAADTCVMGDGTTGYGSVGYTYQIGKYEVTAGQYCEFLNKVARVDKYYLGVVLLDAYGCGIQRSGDASNGELYTYTVTAEYANRPVTWVSFGDACRFANWLHNGQPEGILTGYPPMDAWLTEDGAYSLNGAVFDWELLAPTVTRKAGSKWAVASEDEWYKAAYYDASKPGGAGYWRYPTGSDSAPGRDVSEATNPGNNANYYAGNYLIGSPYYRTPVGEFELSDSPYGTFDQGGNVFEWNEAVVPSPSGRGVRGGSCILSDDSYLLASARYSERPGSKSVIVGFRVVRLPVPGDVDGDNHVDVLDLLYVVDSFGSITGDPNYDARCDFNYDGTVDVVDLLDLVYNFGT